MKKVFAYIGSQSGENSNTALVMTKILDNVIKLSNNKVKYDLYTAKGLNIERCQGCNSCFFTGRCPLDEKYGDSMAQMKEKMLSADLIILGSPVYAHNVSGDMKTFIDRITYWTHLLRLAGKTGCVISTSSGNGTTFVNNYLEKIMSQLGIKVIGKIFASWIQIDEIRNSRKMNKEIEEYSNIIFEYINGKKIESDELLESVFSAYKNSIKSFEKYPNAEYSFWKENGYLECNSFSDLLNKFC